MGICCMTPGTQPGALWPSRRLKWGLLIFAMISFVSFAFSSALSFKISFLLLTLGFFISSFSSCFRCRVRLFIWIFSCFLRCACIAMNFPLRTAFTVSHRFWVVVFSFSFVSTTREKPKKPLDEGESGEWKSWLKAQPSENKYHSIWSHHFKANRCGNSGNSDRLYFWGLQ